MNDEAAEVRKLLAPLRDRPVSVADVERLSTRRARVVSAIKQENVRLHGRRTRRRVAALGLGAALSLAAALGLFFGVRQLSHSARAIAQSTPVSAEARLTLVRGGSTAGGRALHQGDAVSSSESELLTPESGMAELKSSAGLDLDLAESTSLSVAGILGDPSSNHVDLRRGQVTCKVPHLAEGERFSVVTPDARVVVHGTVFSVRFDPEASSASKTCVRVTQGVVIVHHGTGETALNAGDSWGCAPPPASAASDGLAASADTTNDAASAPAPRPGPRASHAVPRDVPSHGTLAEETKLLQSALAAERVGNREQARSLLQTLLSEYPSSPLSHEATRALARVSAAQ